MSLYVNAAAAVASLVVFVGVLAVAVVVARSAIIKARTEELVGLAETRAETIEDLRSEVAELRGVVQGYQAIKSEEIAVEVARLLAPAFDRLTSAVTKTKKAGSP